MKSYSAARMRELDRRSIEEHGIPGAALMENAGTALVRAILRFAAGFDAPEFVILAGKGNNGGDACVAARQLDRRGFPVRLFMTARPDELAGDAAEMFEALPQKLKNELRFEFSSGDLSEQSIVIDGLLGTGVRGDLREPFASWIRIVNESGVPVIAVDIPSGLNADDGTASLCMQADLTVTMAGVKTGMLLERGPLVSGRIEVARIGIPESELEEAADGMPVFTNLDARSLLRREPFDTFKNRRGHLAVIGGSARYASAPFLSAEAALRTGCGLVTLFLPESAEIHCIVRKALILRRVPDEGGPAFCASSLTEIESALQDKSAFALGPGMTDRPETLPFLTRLGCAESDRARSRHSGVARGIGDSDAASRRDAPSSIRVRTRRRKVPHRSGSGNGRLHRMHGDPQGLSFRDRFTGWRVQSEFERLSGSCNGGKRRYADRNLRIVSGAGVSRMGCGTSRCVSAWTCRRDSRSVRLPWRDCG